jgi:hypothetical protein
MLLNTPYYTKSDDIENTRHSDIGDAIKATNESHWIGITVNSYKIGQPKSA